MANVRVRSAKESGMSSQKHYNRMSEYVTENAKSGTEARWLAEHVEYENQVRRNSGKNPKTVKIDSNPVPSGKTRISPMAVKRGPSRLTGGSGGGFGGGGLLPENR